MGFLQAELLPPRSEQNLRSRGVDYRMVRPQYWTRKRVGQITDSINLRIWRRSCIGRRRNYSDYKLFQTEWSQSRSLKSLNRRHRHTSSQTYNGRNKHQYWGVSVLYYFWFVGDCQLEATCERSKAHWAYYGHQHLPQPHAKTRRWAYGLFASVNAQIKLK